MQLPISVERNVNCNIFFLLGLRVKGINRFTLSKKCPYPELFLSAFSRIWTEYGEILRISPYSVRMRENADQNNFEYRHLLRSITQRNLRMFKVTNKSIKLMQ